MMSSALFRRTSLALPRLAVQPTPLIRATPRYFSSSPVSRAANPQSGKPASDNVSHAARNIKEEAGKVRSSLESVIAGANTPIGKDQGGSAEMFTEAKSITGAFLKEVPRPAMLWGLAGLLPYLATSASSVYLARQAWLVKQGLVSTMDLDTATALLVHAQDIQIGYGAVILSFLGGITWGFEFSKFGGFHGNTRYVLGTIPLVAAWPTLLLTPQLALVGQWTAFVVTWFIDQRSTSVGRSPVWYATYRFYLSFFVGVTIIASLAATQYYDTDESRTSQRPLANRLATGHKKEAEQWKRLGDESGKKAVPVDGDVLTQSTGEDGDSFVQVHNPKKEAEEKKKKKEEEDKKAKEDKKDEK